jgi:starvation-inducible DNA-binding protein
MAFDTSAPAASPHAFSRFAGMHMAIARKACEESVAVLNRILADTMTLRDLYKKYYWQASGAALYDLHLLFDGNHEEQDDLVDLIAERIQALGGICIAMAAEVAETTSLARPPRNPEVPSLQLARLINAHKRVLYGVRAAARRALEIGDDATHDLLDGDVIPVNERQAWLAAEQFERVSRSPGG